MRSGSRISIRTWGPMSGGSKTSDTTLKPARSYSEMARTRALHQTHVAPCAGRVAHERAEHRRAGAAAARVRRRRHAPHPPRAGLALGPDEADGHELLAVEGSERDRAGRLVARQLLERLVRPQDAWRSAPGLLERDGADGEARHAAQGTARECGASAPPR